MGLLVRVDGNIDQVFAGLKNWEKLTRVASLNLLALISERIQNRGQRTDGALIGGGVYTKQWAKQRRKKGRQTAYIDLTMTGAMLDRGFTVILGENGWGLGFLDPKQGLKMEGLTKHFGDLVAPTEEEIRLALDDIQNAVRDVLS